MATVSVTWAADSVLSQSVLVLRQECGNEGHSESKFTATWMTHAKAACFQSEGSGFIVR